LLALELSSGSMKWFMPPTPSIGSRTQAEMHEPSTVVIASSARVT